MTTIPLCTLKGGGYNHVWRFVAPITSQANLTNALWQCDDCHRIEMGRMLTGEETRKLLEAKQPVIISSIKVPL